jgi:hypothetical protein
MNVSKSLLTLIIAGLLPLLVIAEEPMDIDQANSLDFQGFHKTKKDAVKLYDSQEGGIFNPQDKQSTEVTAAVVQAEQSPPVAQQSKRYEIRELYTMTKSERTGLTATTDVQALHLQMQGFCPEGWRKLDEWTKPDDGDYYMYYQFECL